MINEIAEIVSVWADLEEPLPNEATTTPFFNPWEHGGVHQAERILGVAKLAATYPGYFAEIGCLVGGTTRALARLARELGVKAPTRRVIAVDPWEPGQPNYDEHAYDEFLKNTAEWSDLIDVVRLRSEDPRAVSYLKEKPLCFAYVDGYHDYPHCRQDIASTHHARVICVDDLWEVDVLRAFMEAEGAKIWNPRCKEGYIITRSAESAS